MKFNISARDKGAPDHTRPAVAWHDRGSTAEVVAADAVLPYAAIFIV